MNPSTPNRAKNPLHIPLKFFPINELTNEAKESSAAKPPREVIYSSTDPKYLQVSNEAAGMPAFVTMRNGLQIIACRNIHTNVRLSMLMALRMATDSKSKNTGYKGSGFTWENDPTLRPATPEELERDPKPTRPRFDAKAKNGSANAWKNSDDVRVLYVNSYASSETLLDEAHWLTGERKVKLRNDMPLGLVSVPIGTWSEKLAEIRKLIIDNQFTTVIINAFEFIALSQRQKSNLTIELLQMRDELGVTFIIFSQEVRKQMEAGTLGRGPLGRLQVFADSVVKIEDDLDIWDNCGEIQEPAPTVEITDESEQQPSPLLPADVEIPSNQHDSGNVVEAEYEQSLNTPGEGVGCQVPDVA